MADALVNVLNGVRGGLSDVLRNIQSTLQPKASSHHPGDEHTKTMTDGLQTDTSSRESRAIAIEAVSAAPLLAGQQHVSIGPVTREDLGRSTWLLLHTLAAQYPSRPSRQQRKDVAALVDTLTRIYPCGECAVHFRDIVRSNPPKTADPGELQQWVCEVHNTVNRSLGKASFNCNFVQARWGALDCGDDMACDLDLSRR